jgi:hypothetical protein
MITFDERGHLLEPIELNLTEFKEIFVDEWQDKTSTRPNIFATFEQYLTDFKALITPDFHMWVNGSFVTQKSHPRDIDFVCFIDYTIYFNQVKLIDNQFGKYGTKDVYGLQLDGYVSPVYPKNHQDAFTTQSNKVYWISQFSSTKPDRHQKKYSKGFIKINFNENE